MYWGGVRIAEEIGPLPSISRIIILQSPFQKCNFRVKQSIFPLTSEKDSPKCPPSPERFGTVLNVNITITVFSSVNNESF